MAFVLMLIAMASYLIDFFTNDVIRIQNNIKRLEPGECIRVSTWKAQAIKQDSSLSKETIREGYTRICKKQKVK